MKEHKQKSTNMKVKIQRKWFYTEEKFFSTIKWQKGQETEKSNYNPKKQKKKSKMSCRRILL